MRPTGRAASAVVAVALLTAARPAAAGEQDDPRLLFQLGRYDAAAAVFERRWQAGGGAADAVNAVVAWRTAGHYAHARALLARVRGETALAGARAERATQLDATLVRLTGTITLTGDLPGDAVIEVDGDPAERIGGLLVVDIGDRELSIERAGCTPFHWAGLVSPGATLRLPVALDCPRRATLHLVLAGERRAELEIDGRAQVVDRERELELSAGDHRLRLTHRARPVIDEPVALAAGEARTERIRFPWRARRGGLILGLASLGAASSAGATGGAGIALGWSGSRFRAVLLAGTAWSTARRIDCTVSQVTCSHPWLGGELALHGVRPPRWQSRHGARLLTLDVDPLALRVDQVRESSMLGIRVNFESTITHVALLPVTLTAEWPALHLEVTLWPLGVAHRTFPIQEAPAQDHRGDSQTGLGASLTVTAAWMPWPR